VRYWPFYFSYRMRRLR